MIFPCEQRLAHIRYHHTSPLKQNMIVQAQPERTVYAMQQVTHLHTGDPKQVELLLQLPEDQGHCLRSCPRLPEDLRNIYKCLQSFHTL